MKPTMELKEGKLHIEATTQVDTDKDGVAAIEAGIVIKADVYEVLTEIAKKDLPLLKGFVDKLGL